MHKYLTERDEVTFDHIFNQQLGKFVFRLNMNEMKCCMMRPM